MKRIQLKSFTLLILSTSFLISCTDLEISETDSLITPTNADGTTFSGVADPTSALSEVYNRVGGHFDTQENWYALSEVTSDEFLIPTRGTDWGDNGLWRVLHQHSWNFEHSFLNNTWNQWNTTQLLASEIIDPRSNASAEQVAEAKFLRAFAQFIILDLWGVVPVRDLTLPPTVLPEVLDGTAAVAGIIQDLNDAISGLPTVGPGNSTIKANKSTARFLLAKILLNKHIYNGTATPNGADLTEVVSLVDAISADGYALQAGYFDLFRDVANNETIFSVPKSNGSKIWNSLHYNLGVDVNGGGWNGFSTLAEFYDLFEGDANTNIEGGTQEERRGFVPLSGKPVGAPGTTDIKKADGSNGTDGYADGSNVGFGFLIGQQYSLDGTPLNDRSGNPLVFTREFKDASGATNLQGNNEITGIRLLKYHPQYGAFVSHQVVFRYSDAYLMKAEAIMRNNGDATAMVNALRILRGANPIIGSMTEDDMIDERGRELYGENWRRNDLIRFGTYTRDWEFKEPSSVGNDIRNRFPIPAAQLITNPNLVQNPGY